MGDEVLKTRTVKVLCRRGRWEGKGRDVWEICFREDKCPGLLRTHAALHLKHLHLAERWVLGAQGGARQGGWFPCVYTGSSASQLLFLSWAMHPEDGTHNPWFREASRKWETRCAQRHSWDTWFSWNHGKYIRLYCTGSDLWNTCIFNPWCFTFFKEVYWEAKVTLLKKIPTSYVDKRLCLKSWQAV